MDILMRLILMFWRLFISFNLKFNFQLFSKLIFTFIRYWCYINFKVLGFIIFQVPIRNFLLFIITPLKHLED
jgi:hypothetical protein